MKKYLAIFVCAEDSENHKTWKKLDETEKKELFIKGEIAKAKWQNKYKDHLIEGSSTGKTKTIDKSGCHDVPSRMGAFQFVLANSHEEASQIFIEHPHFTDFPGDAVEVIECNEK